MVVGGAQVEVDAPVELAPEPVYDDVTWVSADFGPSLQEKVQQAFVKHPDANTFLPAFDAIMTQSGGVQALTATGRLPQLTVTGGEVIRTTQHHPFWSETREAWVDAVREHRHHRERAAAHVAAVAAHVNRS